MAVKTTVQLGFPESVVVGLGVMTFVIAVLYAMPRTSLPGGILLAGLLGGAMATHLRAGSPIVSHLLFGLYIGVMAWAGLICATIRCAR